MKFKLLIMLVFMAAGLIPTKYNFLITEAAASGQVIEIMCYHNNVYYGSTFPNAPSHLGGGSCVQLWAVVYVCPNCDDPTSPAHQCIHSEYVYSEPNL